MIVSPVTIAGKNMYHVTMTDRYDFKFETIDYQSDSMKKAAALAGNNLAYIDMESGALNDYDITIEFYVE